MQSVHQITPQPQATGGLPRRPREIPVLLFLAGERITCLFWSFVSTLRLKLVLRLLRCPYGEQLYADGPVVIRIRRTGSVRLGRNIKIHSRFRSNLVGLNGPAVLHCIRDGRISIGDNSGFSSTVFSSRTSIQVGSNVKIGGNVRIYDHDFHSSDWQVRRDWVADRENCPSAPVVIGDDVFIGANVIILKGVSIGDRCIVGAGAVVGLKNIPPDSLVAGNPARIIKTLAAPGPP